MKRRGICFRCMFGECQHCYGDSQLTACQCRMSMHDIRAAKVALRMDPDSMPPPFIQETSANDRFYFLPESPIVDPEENFASRHASRRGRLQ